MLRIARRILRYWTGQRSDWYRQTRRMARALARRHGVTLGTAAGVIAALSPRVQWGRNMTVADELLSGRTPSGVFGANQAKAQAIRSGRRPLDVLSGPKVRAFYRTIMGHDDPVVDVWMLRAAGIRKATRSAVRMVAGALRRAAAMVQVAVHELQAAVWVKIRGRST